MAVKVSEKERISQINNLPNIRFVRWDGEYKNKKSKVVCRCDNCSREWCVTIDNLVNGRRGCPQCFGKLKFTADERMNQINALPNIRFVRWCGPFKSVMSKALVRCEIDGHEWSAKVNNLVNIGSGCPYCARYGKTEEQPAPNVTVEIPTDIKPAFDLLNW